MIQDRLEALRSSEAFAGSFLHAISYLRSQGIIDILRETGRVPEVSPDAKNYAENTIAVANWSKGYNVALDHLENFLEIFLHPESNQKKSVAQAPDYGAEQILIKNGVFTAEEIAALKGGK